MIQFCNYYGSLSDLKPVRTLADDLIKEYELAMLENLKSMEERIKRHITECKREVIKELILRQPIEENKDGRSSKKGTERKSS
jgi:hypothetical protein